MTDNDHEDIHSIEPATLQPPALAREPNILAAVSSELAASGVAGEIRLGQLLYLAITSRLLDRPCSVVVKGPSAAGKSYLVEQVLRLFPPAAYHALTAMSEHALVYDTVPLVHRMLVLYEAAGLTSDVASYLMRSLLSEGHIAYTTVARTKHGFGPQHVERPGPTGLITTTTAVALHPENETRLLSLTVNDSPDQTRAVMLAHATGRKVDRDRTDWQALQAWLAASKTAVVIPYAEVLAAAIPPVATRLRRDFAILLVLIEAHALLHSLSRAVDPAGVVVAKLTDYAAVRGLVAEIMAEGAERTVASTIRETVEAVAALAPPEIDQDVLKEGVTVTAVATRLGLDKSAALRRTRVAIARGFLRNLEPRRGRPAQLVLGDPLPEDNSLLPTAAELERLQGCSVTAGDLPMPIELDYPRSAWAPEYVQ